MSSNYRDELTLASDVYGAGQGRFPRPLSGMFRLLVFGAVVAVVLRVFVLETIAVDSASMGPVLMRGDRVVVLRKSYGESRMPQRGDIVLIALPGAQKVLRRVAGLPGDRISRTASEVLINGERAASVFPDAQSGRVELAEIVLKAGEFYVLAELPQAGADSRTLGPVKGPQLKGKAVFVYWSWARRGASFGPSWERIGPL